ncbi:hypothetical protein [Neorhizobium sp. AL 9.2.2]|nr:hypothetical protein [Neorhizobium sp. AL 9.2.2]NSY19962.1 hypothetical protein [Neorhizobium sp. AL 9.2.2]
MEDFEEKIGNLKQQFNTNNVEVAIRKLLFLARNNGDEEAKRRLMVIVRDLVPTVATGKTPGHQPAFLQMHRAIANIMASMGVLDPLQQQFMAASNGLIARIAAGEIDPRDKLKKLLNFCGEELKSRYLDCSK